MNFLSLFPRLQLLVWLCFNRACRFRKMRGGKSRSWESERERKRCLCRKHLIWTFLRWSDRALPKWDVGAKCKTRNSLHEERIARGILMIQGSRNVSNRRVLLWAPDMNWIITTNRSQHLLVASHKSRKGKKKKRQVVASQRCEDMSRKRRRDSSAVEEFSVSS